MNYSKPEITVLGHAALVIQGTKGGGQDSLTDTNFAPSDCEFDD